MAIDIDSFKGLCQMVVDDPALQPAPDGSVTHCNEGLQRIAKTFGFFDFEGKLANQCIDLMENDDRFDEVEMDEAWQAAQNGKLVIACVREEPHGHVAVLCPGDKVFSAKWNKDAPLIANVGKKNGVMGENYAFREPPTHYVYNEPAA